MSRNEMKRLAKVQMRAQKPNALVMGLVFYLITYVLGTISQAITLGPVINDMMSNPEQVYQLLESGYTPEPSLFGAILNFAIEIMSAILSFGFMIYCLSIVRNYPAGFGTLFDGFGMFWKIIWLNLRMGIVIFLWSLLLVVPGIIAAYSYRQSAYILMDHPDWSVKQCMRESKRLMGGHKMELFILDLSFIGWNLLTIIPFVIIYVLPYTETTYAVYYNRLSGWQPDPEETEALPEKAPWEY